MKTLPTDAVVFPRAGAVVLQKVTMPPPGPGQVRVRTVYSTVSAGTEGWVWRNEFTWSPTRFPCVPGYQRVGTISALGADVQGWMIGDQVLATTGQWEGPVAPFWGSHIAEANTAASELYRLPAGLDPVDASGAVVAQVGYNAASRVDVKAGDWVIVYGDGLIGQLAGQAARARGARVLLAGHRPARLEAARQWAVEATVNTRQADFMAAVRRITGGEVVAAVLDTVQKPEAQRQYLPWLKPGQGQIVYSGFTPAPTWADMALLQQRELTTHFVSGWNRSRMEATLALMAQGKIRLRPLVTHLVPFAAAPEMYALLQTPGQAFMGITLDWQGAGS